MFDSRVCINFYKPVLVLKKIIRISSVDFGCLKETDVKNKMASQNPNYTVRKPNYVERFVVTLTAVNGVVFTETKETRRNSRRAVTVITRRIGDDREIVEKALRTISGKSLRKTTITTLTEEQQAAFWEEWNDADWGASPYNDMTTTEEETLTDEDEA